MPFLPTRFPEDPVFLTDNESPEQYQINSLAFSTPQAVPLPATWLLISAGLAGLWAAGSRGDRR